MRRRVLLLVILTLASLGAIAAVLWLLPLRTEVSLTPIARLNPGLSEEEVAAILGPPTADLTATPPANVPMPPAGGQLLEYVGELATARVVFNADGRLVRYHPDIRTITGMERIRIRLNWWW